MDGDQPIESQQEGEEKPEEVATFLAYLPPIQSAIKVHGNMDGMRIQLDIPEQEMPEALKLVMWRDCLLYCIIRPAEDKDEQQTSSSTVSRREAKQRDVEGSPGVQ